MAIDNNLFPGVVNTYMPAFLIDSGNAQKDTCRVYFSLSNYNSLSDIANVQVTIAYQNNNKSALNTDKYPCAIMLTEIKVDNTKLNNDKYYFEIKKTDMQGNNFEINQYYKVQFRFTSVNATKISLITPQAIDSWLAENLPFFSEWSRVCLVRGISTPTLRVTGLEQTAESIIWSSADTNITGKLTFANADEKEVLKSYQIRLYNSSVGELISDSGILYTSLYNDINQFNYTFPFEFNEGEEYQLIIEYTTNDLYTDKNEYNFLVIQGGGEKLNATLTTTADTENGRVKVHLEAKDLAEKVHGNITIRRTSSESNFALWEDVYTVPWLGDDPLKFDWYDYTIESGIWYKYCVQKRDSLGNRGVILESEEPVLVDLEYIYLTAERQQIKIKFNPSVSSFKRQISEAKVETIGSKYPFIRRNGMVEYRTFPISGMISYFMDEDNIFTSKENIFKQELPRYEEWNIKNRISPYNNFIYERKFRDLVIDFLYKNNVKLFRSATEGNILVKLMDINFTPEPVLGGYVYSFSCTAHEIAECTQQNIDYYKIQPIGIFSDNIKFIDDYFGQSQQVFKAGEDVIQTLQKEYEQYTEEGYSAKIDYLDTVRLEMESQPYLIKEGENGPYPADQPQTLLALDKSDKTYLGYICYINNKPIVINPEGIYELKYNTVEVNSLIFPVDTQVNLEYHLQLSQTEDVGKLYKSTNYFNRVGQYWGTFGYNDSIYKHIWNKYFEKYPKYMQSMTTLNNIRIEAEPGTVVYVKEDQDEGFEKHVIGNTCTLDFGDKDSIINGVYFSGIHLDPANEDEVKRETLPNNKFIETGLSINSLEGIKNPIKNGVYTIRDVAVETVAEEDKNDTIIVEEDEVTETGGKINNKKGQIAGAIIDNRLNVKRKQVEPVLGLSNDNYEINLESHHKDNFISALEADKENPDMVVVDQEQVEENIVTPKPNDYNLITGHEGEHEHGVVKVNEDHVKEDNLAVIDTQAIAAKYYRLLMNKDFDKEFALFMKEIIESANRYIWYNNQWHIFTKENDLICPVEGLIDYYCEVMKGYFAK